MVLRDFHISPTISAISGVVLSVIFMLMPASCKQADSKSNTTPSTSPAPSAITFQVQSAQKDLQLAMQEMNGVYLAAQDLQTNGSQEKSAEPSTEMRVVWEKSAASLGGMFVLQGSLSGIEQRFNEGLIDQKTAEDMLKKLRNDLVSYRQDIQAYSQMVASFGKPGSSDEKKK